MEIVHFCCGKNVVYGFGVEGVDIADDGEDESYLSDFFFKTA